MSKNKNHVLVEEINFHDKKEKEEKDKNKPPLITTSKTDKNDIIIELSHNKKEDDEKSSNSAEFSGNNLEKEKNIQIPKEKAKTSREKKHITLSKKAYEKYAQSLKERTMRMEIEKIDRETERIKQKYEEKNSFLHLFENDPQFQKMLKFVEKQLLLIFILGVIICILNALIYFYVSRGQMSLALANFILSIAEIAILVILFISLKLGLLNDPNMSRAFRLFVIIEFLIIFSLFVINIVIVFFVKEYLLEVDKGIRFIVYMLFILMVLLFFLIFKICFVLFIESVLILLNKKTEYSILMINEQNSKSELNIITNLQTSNNISTEGLNKSSNGIISENNKYNQNNKEMSKEEEQYKNYNYFNKFHYSVTSNRNADKYFNMKNKQ